MGIERSIPRGRKCAEESSSYRLAFRFEQGSGQQRAGLASLLPRSPQAVESGLPGRNKDRVDIHKDTTGIASFLSRARVEVEVSPVRRLLPRSLQLYLPEIQDLSELGSILISKGG